MTHLVRYEKCIVASQLSNIFSVCSLRQEAKNVEPLEDLCLVVSYSKQTKVLYVYKWNYSTVNESRFVLEGFFWNCWILLSKFSCIILVNGKHFGFGRALEKFEIGCGVTVMQCWKDYKHWLSDLLLNWANKLLLKMVPCGILQASV